MFGSNRIDVTFGMAGNVPNHLLIGYGGKVALKESGEPVVTGKTNILEYISEVKQKHSVLTIQAQPVLKLMTLGGMEEETIRREILSVLVSHFQKQILNLNQGQLSQLLEKSYSYLTVPELRPIATLALERLEYVDPTTWNDIVENGVTESPYVDLPLSLKRRIWTAIPSVFAFELNERLKVMPAYREQTTIETIFKPKPRATSRTENKLLLQFQRLVGDSDDQLVQLIDHMVDAATEEPSSARRLALANMLHDVLCVIAPRKLPNLEKLRMMARFLDAGGVRGGEQALLMVSVREIRESMSDMAACGPVSLLVSSTYARDAVVSQIVATLVGQKKMLPSHAERGTFEAMFNQRAQELLRDPFLRDLTYICLGNAHAGALLMAKQPLSDESTSAYYGHYFPLMTHEMAVDEAQMMDGFVKGNAGLPHPELLRGVQNGPFERRVLIHYVFKLMMRKNITGVAKYRLVLDAALKHCDRVEEAKERVIARGLIEHVMHA